MMEKTKKKSKVRRYLPFLSDGVAGTGISVYQ